MPTYEMTYQYARTTEGSITYTVEAENPEEAEELITSNMYDDWVVNDEEEVEFMLTTNAEIITELDLEE